MRLTRKIPYGSTSIRSLRKLVERYGNAKIVATGLNYKERLDSLRLLRKSENFYIELSMDCGVEAARWYTERAGSEMILMGTGFSLFYPMIGVAKVLKARISDEDRVKILHENAARLFGL